MLKEGLEFTDNRFVVEGNYKYKYTYNNGHLAMADPVAAARNFLNALEKIPSTIDQYKAKNEALERDIPQLQKIAGKVWKKEDKLKQLKSELAALDRKIQLELAPPVPEVAEKLMENIIYNELRIRGYSVDVGQVEVRTTNAEGKKIRKLLEVDFICNSGNKRMYIQSALDMPTPEKIDQETNSLRHINDGFPKIVIVGGLTPSYVNTDGISIMNVIDFLKDTEMGLL